MARDNQVDSHGVAEREIVILGGVPA